MSRDSLSPAARHAQKVAELCRYIESAEHSPTLEELAQRAGMSVYHLHRVFKAITGLTPKGLCSCAAVRNACGANLRRRDGHRSDLWRRLQLRRPLLRAGRPGARHDADALSRRRRRNRRSASRSAQCSLGAILVAQSERGVCAISLGDDPRELARELQDRFPQRQPDRRRRGVRAAGRATSWASSRRRASASICRSTCAAPRSSSACGRRCARSRRARRRAMPRSPSASARRNRCARWRRPAARTRWRSRSRAIASCAATARCPAIAGAWSASARCWSARRRR